MVKRNPTDIAIPADPNDPEDFDVTYEALEIGQAVRRLRLLRIDMGMSQTEFALRYGLNVATLRDWEQGRISQYGPSLSASPPDLR